MIFSSHAVHQFAVIMLRLVDVRLKRIAPRQAEYSLQLSSVPIFV